MIILDINKDKLCNKKLVMRVNDKPKEKLIVQVLRDGQVDKWTGFFPTFYGLNAQDKKIMGTKMVRKTDYFEFTFPDNSFSAVGHFKRAYFELRDGDNILTTGDFEIEVINDIGIDKQEAEDIISLNDEIKKAIEDIKKEAVKQQTDLKNESIKQQKELKETAQKDAEKALKTSENALKELEKIAKEQDLNPGKDLEVVQARGAYKNLKDRFDNNEKAIETSEKALEELEKIVKEQELNPSKDLELVQARGDYKNLSERLLDNDHKLNEKINYTDVPISVPTQNSSNVNKKIVQKISETEYNVFSRSNSGENNYTLMKFKNGQGDNSESSHGKNFDLIRLISVMSIKDLLVYNQPKVFLTSKENKNKDDDFTLQTFTTGYDSPKELQYISNNGKESVSSYVEFYVDIKRNHLGELWLSFFGTKNSNKNIEVFVNGVKTDEIDSSSDIPTTVYTKVRVGAKVGKVKIKLKVPDDPDKAKPIHFLGFNSLDLGVLEGKFDINGFLMNINAKKHYITQSSGANEYAVREKTTGKWFGSFHGGEKHNEFNIFLDDLNLKTKDTNSLFIGDSFKLIQDTSLIEKVRTQSITEVNNDSTYSFECRFDVNQGFEVTDFYTCMSCFNDNFNNIILPKAIRVSDTNKEALLPNTGKVIQLSPTTNQFVTTEYTVNNIYYTSNRCRILFFKDIYAKLYHGPVNNSSMVITSLNFGNKKIFH